MPPSEIQKRRQIGPCWSLSGLDWEVSLTECQEPKAHVWDEVIKVEVDLRLVPFGANLRVRHALKYPLCDMLRKCWTSTTGLVGQRAPCWKREKNKVTRPFRARDNTAVSYGFPRPPHH